MKNATEMQPRKERPVISRKEGAATLRSNRANGYPATRRKSIRILTEPEEQEQWSVKKTLLVSIAGALVLYMLMWLSAAY